MTATIVVIAAAFVYGLTVPHRVAKTTGGRLAVAVVGGALIGLASVALFP